MRYRSLMPETFNPDLHRSSLEAYPADYRLGTLKPYSEFTPAERAMFDEGCRMLNSLQSVPPGLVCERPEREHPARAVSNAIRAQELRDSMEAGR